MTWNLGTAYTKFDKDGGKDLKDAICRYITQADIVALQKAKKFDCKAFTDYKFHQTGELITMVKTQSSNSIQVLGTLPVSGPNKQVFAFAIEIQTPDINEGKPIAVLNLNFDMSDKTRKNQITETVQYIQNSLSSNRKFNMIIVLGDFFKYDQTQLKDLLTAISSSAKPVIDLDDKAPVTTCDGARYDNILLHSVNKVDLNLPEFKKNVRNGDFKLYNLVNNYVTLEAFGQDVSNVKKCIDEYVDTQTTISPPCRTDPWLSSMMISDHLPLQLKIMLTDSTNQQKPLFIGTWNIEGQHANKKLRDPKVIGKYLSWKFNDPDIRDSIKAVVNKFDILIFQELYVGDTKLKINQVDSVGQGYPEHGYFVQDRNGVKISVQSIDIVHFSVNENGKAVSRIPINIELMGKDKFRICFYSIHSPTRASQTDLMKLLRELQNDAVKYRSCQLHLALGDWNQDRSRMPNNILKTESIHNEVLSCYGSMNGEQFQYTKVDTRNKYDYILVLNKAPFNPNIVIDECEVLTTGNKKPDNVNIDDWREISNHFPVLAEPTDTKYCPSCIILK